MSDMKKVILDVRSPVAAADFVRVWKGQWHKNAPSSAGNGAHQF
jgi:hypothetical protein